MRAGPRLSPRAGAWTAGLAAGAALTAAAGLFGRWCADPGLGWPLALAAAALGAAAGARRSAGAGPDFPAWTAAGALSALAAPALLRASGLGAAEAAQLQSPLAGAAARTALVLAAALVAAAAWCWARAAAAEDGRAAGAALVGAAAGAAAARAVEAPVLLAAAALTALAAALAVERPWRRDAPSRTRARAFGLAAVAAAALATQAPGLLRDVWTARLHMAYPGGRFLAFSDDGSRAWAGYEYSDHSAASLRDGVLQSWDPLSTAAALRAVVGQRDGSASVLLVDAPDPRAPLLAAHDGFGVAVEWTSAAEAAVVETLGGGPEWRRPLDAAAPKGKPDAALVFVPRPPSWADRRRAAGRSALTALRARLADGAAAGVLLPPDSPPRAVAALLADARAAFGAARAADLASGGVLVVAAPAAPVTDASELWGRLPLTVRLDAPKGAEVLGASLTWRPSPSTK